MILHNFKINILLSLFFYFFIFLFFILLNQLYIKFNNLFIYLNYLYFLIFSINSFIPIGIYVFDSDLNGLINNTPSSIYKL